MVWSLSDESARNCCPPKPADYSDSERFATLYEDSLDYMRIYARHSKNRIVKTRRQKPDDNSRPNIASGRAKKIETRVVDPVTR